MAISSLNVRIKKENVFDIIILSMQNSPHSFKHSKIAAFYEVFALQRETCLFWYTSYTHTHPTFFTFYFNYFFFLNTFYFYPWNYYLFIILSDLPVAIYFKYLIIYIYFFFFFDISCNFGTLLLKCWPYNFKNFREYFLVRTKNFSSPFFLSLFFYIYLYTYT